MDATSEGISSGPFQALVDRHRQEIRAHCYRMLGSIDDAEDATQDALLAAWRGYGAFEGRSSARTWLYRIATNTCLRALERRAAARRVLPQAVGPGAPIDSLGRPDLETPWLEPYPDAALAGIRDDAAGPEARFELLDSVRLAFVAAIHGLPPRQRAVLLLRDVVGLTAVETAHATGLSIAAANSALQRARAKLRDRFPAGPPAAFAGLDEGQERLLADYVRLWEAGDIDGFVGLLARDAVWSMPPWRQWFVGREATAGFLRWAWRSSADGQRLVRTAANGAPAFGYYRRSADGARFEPFAIQVVELGEAEIRSIVNFVEPRFFEAFALPARL